jgi:hypothetical protein
MDRGPIRTRTPSGGMIHSKPESTSTHQPTEEPTRSIREEAAEAPIHRASSSQRSGKESITPPRRKRRIIFPIIGIIIILALAAAGFFVVRSMQNGPTGIDTKEYQAVFFTNGQVYFGKLQSFNNQYLKMTDIFYLQTQSTDTSSNPQQTSTDQSNVQLIKLGNEIHGPEDEMIIARDQVLFYENLKSDGKVAQSIAKYKDTNK